MSNKNDSLGDRMKGYENINRNYLIRHIPVVLRIDGKAFHTFTRGLDKPFDKILMKTMQDTMKYLCENVQGCVFGYTQSDEITLVLTDYATITTNAWFGYNIQKMTSISASMATLAFNRAWEYNVADYIDALSALQDFDLENEYCDTLANRYYKAMFDSRVFNIPKDEVCNCLIWRQQDCVRNSIESVAHANFSQKKLHGKNCNQIQEMLWQERNIDWNKFSTTEKRGSCCIKVPCRINEGAENETIRYKWTIDDEIPVFTQDREYIEKWL